MMAQQTNEILWANNNRPAFQGLSVSMQVNVKIPDVLNTNQTSKNIFTLKNQKTTPGINVKSFRAVNLPDIDPLVGAAITGVCGAVFGYFAVNIHADPPIPSPQRRWSAVMGFVAFAPIGYVILLD